ncbi:MAG: cellulase family glycosylhydrolase [Oscillospiraceae bacterium]|nr:cellulase family glycosylhydrolase [Oscillospiraceae bacterium]
MKKQKLCGMFISAVIMSGLLTSCDTNDAEPAAPDNTQPEIQTSAEEETVSAKVTVEGTKFMVGGKELWINGVNTPWEYWNDFGGSFDPTFWDSHFSDLHDIGVNAVRVWMNCDSMVSIKLKPSGEVREVSEQHWSDIDQLFEIAEKHQIYLMPTLISFDHCKNGQYTDRWRAVITDETAMKSYVDNYVKVFAERYGASEWLLGIDLMNEPDWVHENEECGRLPLEDLSKFFANCTAGIHEVDPDILVTVGMGMIKYNSDAGGSRMQNIVSDEVLTGYAGEKACLDFYTPHYYDWMNNSGLGCAFESSPTDYGLDGTKPAFLGEIGTSTPFKDVYQKCYDLGWNGVMMWCSNDVENHAKNWDDIAAATQNMESTAGDKVFPLGKN